MRCSSHLPRRITGCGAFTLIELLVVVSITTLMIAVLLPALSTARDSARRIQCASNLRQTGITTHLYLSDYSGRFMPDITRYNPADSGRIWKAQDLFVNDGYAPNDANTDGVVGSRMFVCPNGPNQHHAHRRQAIGGLYATHQGYNGPGLGGMATNTAGTKLHPAAYLDEITHSSSMFMFMDSSSVSRERGSSTMFHRSLGISGGGMPNAVHMLTVNIVHVDGHGSTHAIEHPDRILQNVIDPWVSLPGWDDVAWWGGREPLH